MVDIESIRVLGIDSSDLAHDLLTVKQSADFYSSRGRTSIRLSCDQVYLQIPH